MSRRALLAAGASAAFLAACGSSTGSDKADNGAGPGNDTNDPSTTSPSGNGKYALVAFFGGAVLQPRIPQRLTFGVGDQSGALLSKVPDSLRFTITTADGKEVAAPVTVPRHDVGLPRAYYPVPFTAPAPGNYIARSSVGGVAVDAAFQVNTVAEVPIPQAGDKMPVVKTPTVTDAAGVDPICTRKPACPLHAISLDTALVRHRPTALLMSTPAFCQVAICGPVLEVFLTAQPAFADRVDFMHAEVYKSGKQAAANPATATLAPVLEAFHLPFEPCLVLARADGTISERLDTIFDATELQDALHRLTA